MSSLFFDNDQPLVQPGCVYVRSPTNPREFFYIEMQADIKSTLMKQKSAVSSSKEYLWGETLGQYSEDVVANTCTLHVGNLRMHGTRQKLKKPYLIFIKVPASSAPVQPQRVAPRNADISALSDNNTTQNHDNVTSPPPQTTDSLPTSLDFDSSLAPAEQSVPFPDSDDIVVSTDQNTFPDSFDPSCPNSFLDTVSMTIPQSLLDTGSFLGTIPASYLGQDHNKFSPTVNNDELMGNSSDLSPDNPLTNDTMTKDIDGALILPIPAPQFIDCVGVVRYVSKFTTRPVPIITSLEQPSQQ